MLDIWISHIRELYMEIFEFATILKIKKIL